MMAWTQPVTNWSARNYFNYTDWNRIESNTQALAELLQTCGFNVSLSTITDRTDGSYLDFYDSVNRIENNMLTLYNCYAVLPPGWQTPKTTWSYDQSFSYQDTNRIEGNELVLYNLVNGIVQEYPVCGQSLAIAGLGWYN